MRVHLIFIYGDVVFHIFERNLLPAALQCVSASGHVPEKCVDDIDMTISPDAVFISISNGVVHSLKQIFLAVEVAQELRHVFSTGEPLRN